MNGRKEDSRLLTGRARFTDDVHLDRMVHAAFVRSPLPHAGIAAVDTTQALQAGALLVLTANDLPFADRSFVLRYSHPSIRGGLAGFLASDRVRYVGEPVALVVARDRYEAEDLAAKVEVDYRDLPPVATPDEALAEHAPMLHDSWPRNVAAEFVHVVGDADAAFARFPRRMSARFRHGRQVPLPLETRGCVAEWDPGRETLSVWLSTQTHYSVRENLALILGIPEDRVRIVAEHVGGGFGSKSRPYPEEVVVSHASRVLGRPVKWIEDRLEGMLATAHSRDIATELELAYDDQGRVGALRSRLVVDIGAYVFTSGIITAEVAAAHCTGPYRIPDVRVEVRCVGTNKTPMATYRGAGQPEATFPLEVMLDLLGRDLGLSPVEIRRRNLVRPDDLPWRLTIPYGGPRCAFDTGDFPGMLERAATNSGFDEGTQVLPSGERVAWGLAFGMESSGLVNGESARVRIDATGAVTVWSGMSSQGQGQFTSYAQVCAEGLGVRPRDVDVRMGDTELLPFGRGAFASRGAVVGANAVAAATAKLRVRVIDCAARLLDCETKALAIVDGAITRDGAQTGLVLADIARAVLPGGRLFEGGTALQEECIYDTGNVLTFGVSVHAARVAVSPITGFVRILDYYVVHDAGRVLNQAIVEGQVIGGVVEGIGGTLFAEMVHDAHAQPLTGTLAEYLVMTAPEAPRVRLEHADCPATTNPLGARGIGEGGTIAAAPAIVNAVMRAIDPDGRRHLEALFRLPLHPERVLAAFEASASA